MLSDARYQMIEKHIITFERNIAVVRPITKELPREALSDLLECVRSDAFAKWLEVCMSTISGMIVQTSVGVSQTLQFDLPGPQDALPPLAVSGEFPTPSALGFENREQAAESAARAGFERVESPPRQRKPPSIDDFEDVGGFDDDIPSRAELQRELENNAAKTAQQTSSGRFSQRLSANFARARNMVGGSTPNTQPSFRRK